MKNYQETMAIMPYVIEQTSRGERQYDIFSRLLKDRILFIGFPIDDYYANIVIAQLLFLEAEEPEKDVYLYINCPGGYLSSGMAIYDTVQHIKPDVRTICIGQAASMGSLLLAAGTKGKRSALPNARIMIHQPTGGATGQATDIEIQANEIVRLKDNINRIYARHTGRSIEEIERDSSRDFFMDAHQALEYGLIDNVLEDREAKRNPGRKKK